MMEDFGSKYLNKNLNKERVSWKNLDEKIFEKMENFPLMFDQRPMTLDDWEWFSERDKNDIDTLEDKNFSTEKITILENLSFANQDFIKDLPNFLVMVYNKNNDRERRPEGRAFVHSPVILLEQIPESLYELSMLFHEVGHIADIQQKTDSQLKEIEQALFRIKKNHLEKRGIEYGGMQIKVERDNIELQDFELLLNIERNAHAYMLKKVKEIVSPSELELVQKFTHVTLEKGYYENTREDIKELDII